MSTTTNSSSPSSSLALLLQQHLQTSMSAPGVSSVAAQALLKQQEDQLRATRLLLQQRQLDELLASSTAAAVNPPASRSNSLLARGPVAGLLGLSNVAASQDALAALARRASVNSVTSEASNQAAAEDDMDEEEGIADEEYFKAYALKDGKEDQDKESDPDDKACNESFPHKLYRMLYEAEKDGLEAIVSFLPSGLGFTIHKPKEFVAEIMPRYFTTRRIASFQRQLNLYGFRRISEGKEKGAYSHKHFVKGKRTRVQRIKRKSTSSRPSVNPFAQRFATAAPLQPFASATVPTSASFFRSGLSANSAPAFNSAVTKELLLARYAAAAAPQAAPVQAPASSASQSLVELIRMGLLPTSAAPKPY